MSRPAADRVAALAGRVEPADRRARQAAAERNAQLAKPHGSLGRLEALAVQLAGSSGRCPPPTPALPAVLVCVADHGVHAHGVSPWPQTVTQVMATRIAAGTASLGALARTVGAGWQVLDVGCAIAPEPHPALTAARVRAGTADWTREPAMSRDEAARAMLAGADAADGLLSAGVDLLVHGEMGLGNTTTAAALLAALTGRPASEVTGPGTDSDPTAPERKAALVEAARARHRPDPRDPLGVLAAVGGLEHAALAGATLACAARRVPVVLDGVSSVAAALLAVTAAPTVVDHLIAGHRSPEPGAAAGLAALGQQGLLDLGLRLGEGTGGVLAVPLVIAAARALADTARLDDLALE